MVDNLTLILYICISLAVILLAFGVYLVLRENKDKELTKTEVPYFPLLEVFKGQPKQSLI